MAAQIGGPIVDGQARIEPIQGRQMVSTIVKSPKDFWTGVIYMGFGAFAFWIARDYSFGTASRMGPGYFPSVLSGLLMLFGALALLRGIRKEGPPLGVFAWKAAAIVLIATAAFGFLLARAGLVIALIVLILGSASASAKFRFEWKAALAAIGLITFCVLVFLKGLGLPIPLLGSWFGG
jgi:hypothetical protein